MWWRKALTVLNSSADAGDSDNRGGRGDSKKKRRKVRKTGPSSDIYKIIRMLMQRRCHPVIVFSFSKRDCESHAQSLSKLDFTDKDEKKLIQQIFRNAMDSLSEDDRHLPQVESILPLLKIGIGIHHGGLLPILKEVIEILFSEGLLKCLFATETFSMGLNMPAKTVVFTSVRKFDGENFRIVHSGEYIQMSGRAGRRGLDDRGLVILMLDELIEPHMAKDMIKGEADPLNSAFYLSYNMLLNLLRVEEANPEYMMQRSLFQFQAGRSAPKLQLRLDALQSRRDAVVVPDEKNVADYHYIRTQMQKLRREMRSVIVRPLYVLPFLNAGRLVHLEDSHYGDWGWGVVISHRKQRLNTSLAAAHKLRVSVDCREHVYLIEVLVRALPDDSSKPADRAANKEKNQNNRDKYKSWHPCLSTNKSVVKRSRMIQRQMVLQNVLQLSSVRLYVSTDMSGSEARRSVGKSLREVRRRFPDGLPLLDPLEDMKIPDESFKRTVAKIEVLEKRMLRHSLHGKKDLSAHLLKFEARLDLDRQIGELHSKIKNTKQDIVLMAKLKAMKRVLRRLGHTTGDNVIDIKGRVACEVSTCDELLVTELMFNGVFNELDAEQVAALCSCLVFTERTKKGGPPRPRLIEGLLEPYRQLQAAARRIAEVVRDSKDIIDVEEYVDKFSSGMMELVYAWCKGAKFADVCKMTDSFEGSIIRAMRRLEELLRQLASAAKGIGNADLEGKFNGAITKMHRDIVFHASLYL